MTSDILNRVTARIQRENSKKDLEFKYQESAGRAAHFSSMARDPITQELAVYYQREAAKYALMLRMFDLASHHYGKTGHHTKNCAFRAKKA